MANITISDLSPAGSDLFADSESFLLDLTEQEMETLGIKGGGFSVVCVNKYVGFSLGCYW